MRYRLRTLLIVVAVVGVIVGSYVMGTRLRQAERELILEMRDLRKSATATEHVTLNAADFVVMERVAPVQVGKWRIMPPGVEDDPKQRPQ